MSKNAHHMKNAYYSNVPFAKSGIEGWSPNRRFINPGEFDNAGDTTWLFDDPAKNNFAS